MKYNKSTLEAFIASGLLNYPQGTRFDIFAFELWNSGDGYSVNSSWRIATNCTMREVLEHARARWEVYKVNYAPRARIIDLEFPIEYHGESFAIEHHGIPVLEFLPLPLV